MSINTSLSSVGGTLAGGIQDVAAILPLIGTDQCDKHVGSALKGGYLYAAATPLSIFGSLGIVKAGISILISSISISIPHISISFDSFRPSVKYLGKKKWFGGKMLKDAGFEMAGTVAPLIGMDGDRFQAETRFIHILEEKHIDDPSKISVSCKSRQWNVMLILCTILAAALSVMPYIALLRGPASWRPKHVHLPWLYPALRISGSCCATVTSQLLIQSRVVSVIKNRIIFMILQQRLGAEYKERFNAWLKDPNFLWDPNLPAEQCIWTLEQYPSSCEPLVEPVENAADQDHTIAPMAAFSTLDGLSQGTAHYSIKVAPPRSPLGDLHQLHEIHFPHPYRDTTFTLLLWVSLALALPVTVTGYIGCFTLVGATLSTGNGPLVWVGLEAALSVLRVFMWASNPNFDEETEITVELTLSEQQPMVTTNDYNPYITDLGDQRRKPFTLVPEHEFLARITPFTGPVEQYQQADNITLYFTLTAEYEILMDGSRGQSENLCLFMTIFDFNMQLGVTFVSSKTSSYYYDAIVKYNPFSRRLEASIQSDKRPTHPWRIEDDNSFRCLETYYHYVAGALKHRDTNTPTAILPWKWDLSPQSERTNQSNSNVPFPLPLVTHHNQLYLKQGYEHHLKSSLIATWSEWIVTDMGNIGTHARLEPNGVYVNTQRARWLHTELDVQLVWEWATRELVVLMLSLELECILQERMEACISRITREIGEGKMGLLMRSEWHHGWRERLEQERKAAMKRTDKAMKEASEHADRKRRCWEKEPWEFQPRWNEMKIFIDKEWMEGINSGSENLRKPEVALNSLKTRLNDSKATCDPDRFEFTERLRRTDSWCDHWRSQHQVEEEMMKSTVEHVRLLSANSTRDQLDTAYNYPKPDPQATKKFVKLGHSSSKGKGCSAPVYDALGCDKEVVCDVIAKKTTRSVLNVDPRIVSSILPNNHLLFLGGEDAIDVEPLFVQKNRDRWWSQQTTNCSTFYFTPTHVWDDNSCSCNTTQVIAHMFIFLTVPSMVCVYVIHRGGATKVSLIENGEVLECLYTIPTESQPRNFKAFVLQPGAHDLELVPQVRSDSYPYFLHDIVIQLSTEPSHDSASSELGAEDLSSGEQVAPEEESHPANEDDTWTVETDDSVRSES